MSLPVWASNLAAYSVQVLLVVASGALAAAAFRIRDARVRLPYWQALLLTALLLPAVQPWRRSSEPAGAAWLRTSVAIERVAMSDSGESGLRVVATLLAAGVALRLLWLATGLWRLARYRRNAQPLDLGLARELSGRLGVAAPHVYASRDVGVPVTFGARRPAILLPPGILELPSAQQQAIVCHEILHVRRRDWLATVAEECVRSLLWFHPAIGWLLGRLRLSREQLVDRQVVEITGRPDEYLEALLAVARTGLRRQPAPATLFLKESHLKDRIDALLTEVSMSTKRTLAVAGLGAIVVFFAGVLAVSAFPLEAPAQQRADAKEKKEPVAHGVPEGVTGGVPGGVAASVGGGVPGGVPCGVVGGVPGGVPGGVGECAEEKAQSTRDTKESAASDSKKARPPRKVLHKVDPQFPWEDGKKVTERADVVLQLTIDQSGAVSDVRLLRGHKAFNDAAVEAVKQWKFEPSDESPAIATVTIRFVPPPPPPPPPRKLARKPPPPPPAPGPDKK